MALVLADRVRDSTTTTGTGTVTLSGTAPTGYQNFSVIGNANTTFYTIQGSTTEWEVGIGTYTSSGTTLSRDTVLSSSNSGSAVNFSAGTKSVFCDLPSSKVVYNGGPLGTPSSGTATNLTGTASININGTVGATTPTTGAFTTLSASGLLTSSANGAASTPNHIGTGTVFTGGTGTTTFPYWFIQPTGTAAVTTWSTSGTALGMNLTSGFVGNFIDFRVAGAATTFRVTAAGVVTTGGTIASGGNVSGSSFIAGSNYSITSKSVLSSASDGIWNMSNNAGTDFSRLQFGGTTSSFPALKRSSTTIAVRLADDSADAPLTASTLSASGASISSGTASTTQGSLVLHNTTANSTTIKSSNSATMAYTITLPVDDGTSGQVLSTNGSGVTSWTTAATQTSGDFATLPTVSSTGGGNSITYTTQTAKYVLTGKTVTDEVSIEINTASGGSGSSQINNALSNAPLTDVSCAIGDFSAPAGLSSPTQWLTLVVLAGTTTGLLYGHNVTTPSRTRITNSNFSAAGNVIKYSATYQIP